nr:ComF family protein [Candidatus Babeliales bacterium]
MIQNFALQAYNFFCDIISPPQCYSCKAYTKERVILCSTCQNNIELIAPKMFTINDRYILTVYALTRYTEPLRPMIFAKYRSDPGVLKKLAQLIWNHSVLPHVHVDALIPIPLHWSRNLKRGFNQAEILADTLSKLSKIPVLYALKRIKKTQYQVHVEH